MIMVDLGKGPDFTAVHLLSRYERAHSSMLCRIAALSTKYGKLALLRQVELENEVARNGRVFIESYLEDHCTFPVHPFQAGRLRVRVPIPIPARVLVSWWLEGLRGSATHQNVSNATVPCVRVASK